MDIFTSLTIANTCLSSTDEDSLSHSDSGDQEQMIALNPNDDHLITADWSRSNDGDENDNVSDFPSSAPEVMIETSPISMMSNNNNRRKRPTCKYLLDSHSELR